MLVTSRSYLEYRAFFALGDEDLRRAILDCSAGASGFAAEANARGGRVTAVDPAYELSRDQLLAAATESAAEGGAMVADNDAHFVWDWYGSRQQRDELRRDALARFADAAHPAGLVVLRPDACRTSR